MKTIMGLTHVHLRVSLKTTQNSLGALCLCGYAFSFYLLLPSLSVSECFFFGGGGGAVLKKEGKLPSPIKKVIVVVAFSVGVRMFVFGGGVSFEKGEQITISYKNGECE